MALTRKMLKGMSLTDEQIDTIIEAHSESVDALKDERDKYKEQAGEFESQKKQIEDLQKQIKDFEAGKSENDSYKEKYESTKKEYDDYKKGVDAENLKRNKTEAFKGLLKEIGISEKRIGSVVKVSDIDAIKLDKDGKIEDAENLTKSLKEEWSDFIVTEGSKGAKTENPPTNNGGKDTNDHYALKRVTQQRENLYGAVKNSKEE